MRRLIDSTRSIEEATNGLADDRKEPCRSRTRDLEQLAALATASSRWLPEWLSRCHTAIRIGAKTMALQVRGKGSWLTLPLTQQNEIGSPVIIHIPLSIQTRRGKEAAKGVGTAYRSLTLTAYRCSRTLKDDSKDVPQFSFVPLFCWFLASSSGRAVVYSGDENGIGIGNGIVKGDVAILCIWQLNKELIVDKFRHFSSAVFGLSILCVRCSSAGIKRHA